MAGESDDIPSPDDPKRLIEQVIAMGDEFPGPAEDLLLSWMLSLPAEADVPLAAGRLIARHQHQMEHIGKERPLQKLWRLLTETAQAKSGRGHRRGGAGARRA